MRICSLYIDDSIIKIECYDNYVCRLKFRNYLTALKQTI